MNPNSEQSAWALTIGTVFASYHLGMYRSGVSLERWFSPLLIAAPVLVLYNLIVHYANNFGKPFLVFVLLGGGVFIVFIPLLYFYFFPNDWVQTESLGRAFMASIFFYFFQGLSISLWPVTFLMAFAFPLVLLFNLPSRR